MHEVKRMKKLFYNGEIITVDSKNTICQAMVIQGDKITYVGSTQQALRLIDDETEMVDLCGCGVVPGFIDCHIHMAVADLQSIWYTEFNYFYRKDDSHVHFCQIQKEKGGFFPYPACVGHHTCRNPCPECRMEQRQ